MILLLSLLQFIIQFDVDEVWANYHEEVDLALVQSAAAKGIQLLGWGQVRQHCGSLLPAPAFPDEVAVCIYITSTATGSASEGRRGESAADVPLPLGVQLTHRNMVGCLAGTIEIRPATPQDTMLSYLPLADILELTSEARRSFVVCVAYALKNPPISVFSLMFFSFRYFAFLPFVFSYPLLLPSCLLLSYLPMFLFASLRVLVLFGCPC